MSRSEDSLATLVLTNHLTEANVKALSPKEFWTVSRAAGTPSSVLEGLDGRPDGLTDRLKELKDQSTVLALELEQLEHSGIRAITPFDDAYPPSLRERLKDLAPPVLFAAGDLSLLSEPGLGIVGSRNVHPDTVEVVQDAARSAVRNELAVVSGGARGVDQIAMNSAFASDGHVIGVLADSLTNAIKSSETRRAILDGAALLLSTQRPSMGFTVGGAMSRNKIIYALSRVTFVATSDSGKGGTWAGATEALKNGYGQVAVWIGPGAGPGNEQLAELGADPIVEIDEIFSDSAWEQSPVEQSADQLRFGV